MASVYKHGRVRVLLAAILSVSCAHLTPPEMEYRAGRALYSDPKFSFQVPEGWRPATGADWSRFSMNAWVMDRMNERDRAYFVAQGRADLARYHAVLIHQTGAWMDVKIAVSQGQGAMFRRGQGLTDIERDFLWRSYEKALVDAAPATDKPRYSLEYMDLADYGPNTALSLIMTKMDRRGTTRWNLLGFLSETHIVTVSIGTVERSSDVIDGLDLIGRTFRFE
jgi:hypothetical protein